MLRVVIVDDHEAFTDRLAAFIAEHRCSVVGTASDALSGLDVVRTTRPNVVLIDIGLPGDDGFWLCGRIEERRREIRVVLMSGQGDPAEYARAAEDAGAVAYVPKTAITRDLPMIINAIAAELEARGVAGGQPTEPSASPGPQSIAMAIETGETVGPGFLPLVGPLAGLALASGIAFNQPGTGLAGALGILLLSHWQWASPANFAAKRESGYCSGYRPVPAQESSVSWAARASLGRAPRGEQVMQRFVELVGRILREEEGQDLIEYALIAGFVSIICWAVIQLTGQSVSTIWDNVNAAVSAAT